MKTLRMSKKDWKLLLIEVAWEIAKPHLKKAADALWEKLKKRMKKGRS